MNTIWIPQNRMIKKIWSYVMVKITLNAKNCIKQKNLKFIHTVSNCLWCVKMAGIDECKRHWRRTINANFFIIIDFYRFPRCTIAEEKKLTEKCWKQIKIHSINHGHEIIFLKLFKVTKKKKLFTPRNEISYLNFFGCAKNVFKLYVTHKTLICLLYHKHFQLAYFTPRLALDSFNLIIYHALSITFSNKVSNYINYSNYFIFISIQFSSLTCCRDCWKKTKRGNVKFIQFYFNFVCLFNAIFFCIFSILSSSHVRSAGWIQWLINIFAAVYEIFSLHSLLEALRRLAWNTLDFLILCKKNTGSNFIYFFSNI